MFEQTSRLAEKLATSVSRRGFLGALGRWAVAAALGVGGVLTSTGTAWAGSRGFKCCVYGAQEGICCVMCIPKGSTCPLLCNTTCGLLGTKNVDDCQTDCVLYYGNGACTSCP